MRDRVGADDGRCSSGVLWLSSGFELDRRKGRGQLGPDCSSKEIRVLGVHGQTHGGSRPGTLLRRPVSSCHAFPRSWAKWVDAVKPVVI